jgi:hypothetical protein
MAMRRLICAVVAASMASSLHAPVFASGSSDLQCGLPETDSLGQLRNILSHRAIEAVRLAKNDQSQTGAMLRSLISPDARVSVQQEDFIQTVGIGPSGLVKSVAMMQADKYRFWYWSGPAVPATYYDACGDHEIEVEFIDTERNTSWAMTFVYRSGRISLIEAVTQQFEAGAVLPTGR